MIPEAVKNSADAVRRIIMMDEPFRTRALELCGGKSENLWIVASYAIAMVGSVTFMKTKSTDVTLALLIENNMFTIACATRALGLDNNVLADGMASLMEDLGKIITTYKPAPGTH